ncbi:MAG: hypothetical protein A2X08_16880 [Bacteroidetes bacterium GWA2_32_17]|nr:MAG: hypothetical protein A2X08_16880 [Bacteroidetes bacterium GWA2_32_17]
MKIFTPIIFIVLLSVIFSCQKNKEEKITGKWQFVYLTNAGNTIQTWSFNNDNSLIRSITTDSTISDTAKWDIQAKAFSRPDLTITSLNYDFDGVYEVLTLNKKFLIIERIILTDGNTGGAFKRYEFVKSK